MKSNYERNAFRIKYTGLSFLLWLLVFVGSYLMLPGEWKKIGQISLGYLVVVAVIYAFTYHMLDGAYSEIEKVSEEMIKVVEGEQETASEEYKQGTVGIFYTNFYKMVSSLKESKLKEQELPHIFTRFYRVHQEVNPNSVGIGLSLTKSIVEGMGGSIAVRSEEGKYTWFILTFVK